MFSFQCYDHVESSVRKASVFCLVAIHSAVGEETLMPHLAELSGTKVRSWRYSNLRAGSRLALYARVAKLRGRVEDRSTRASISKREPASGLALVDR